MNILDLITRETRLAFRKAGHHEYCGPCPFCQDGDDRFRIWPDDDHPRYWCRVCEQKGDAIQFCRDYLGMTYPQACAHIGVSTNPPLRPQQATSSSRVTMQRQAPPAETWTETARQFVANCQQTLLESDRGLRARQWLHSRGLHDDTLRAGQIGLIPDDRYEPRANWGLPPAMRPDGKPKDMWLPKGVVIPWFVDGQLWRVNLRRPVGDPKYYQLPGGAAIGLYNVDALCASKPVVLVEGELDSLTIHQEASDMVTAVATGTTQGARRAKWVARLAIAPLVLVAFDNDANGAGDQASIYWTDILPNARRWRPFWGDANGMKQDGVDVRAWLAAGLELLTISESPHHAAQPG